MANYPRVVVRMYGGCVQECYVERGAIPLDVIIVDSSNKLAEYEHPDEVADITGGLMKGDIVVQQFECEQVNLEEVFDAAKRRLKGTGNG